MNTVKIKKCSCGNEIKIQAEVIAYNQSNIRITGAANVDATNHALCVCGKVHPLNRYVEKWQNENQPNRLGLPEDGWKITRAESVDPDCESALTREITAKLEKELHRLQRDLNSHRLLTYIPGDTSDEEKARQAERASKLARFNEILNTLHEVKS